MSSRRDIDHALDEIDENIHLFERTLRTRVEIPEVQAARVLALLDGSNQQDTVRALAESIAARLGAECRIHSLSAGGEGAPLTDDRDRLPFEILELVEREDFGLVVLPTPFLEDYLSLGAASLGVVADVLLARSPVPMIHVREPIEDIGALLERGVLITVDAGAEACRAAGWMWRLTEGPLQVLVAMSSAEHHAVLEFGRTAADPVTEEDIGRRLGDEVSPLLAALQALARGADRVVEGHAYPEELREVLRREDFPVCFCAVPGRESPDQTGPLARESVRYCRGPVLVVP